jgi:hypothetical protein
MPYTSIPPTPPEPLWSIPLQGLSFFLKRSYEKGIHFSPPAKNTCREGRCRMTLTESETIECPACKKKQAVDVYQTINALENPELVQKLMVGELNVLTCTACGHVAQIVTPLLFNDHRIDLKIQFYPEHWLTDNPERVCNDYLGMLKEMEKFRQEYGLFMPDSNKPGSLLVVFSIDEMKNQIKFRTKLFEMANSGMND